MIIKGLEAKPKITSLKTSSQSKIFKATSKVLKAKLELNRPKSLESRSFSQTRRKQLSVTDVLMASKNNSFWAKEALLSSGLPLITKMESRLHSNNSLNMEANSIAQLESKYKYNKLSLTP